MKRMAYVGILVYLLLLWGASWAYGSDILTREAQIKNSAPFEVTFQENRKETGLVAFLFNDDEIAYDVTIEAKGSNVAKTLQLPEIGFDKVGVVDLNGNGYEDRYFLGGNNNNSAYSSIVDTGIIEAQTGELIHLRLIGPSQNTDILKVIGEKGNNYHHEHFQKERDFIDRLKQEDWALKEYGYIDREERDQTTDDPDLSFHRWNQSYIILDHGKPELVSPLFGSPSPA